MGNCHVGRCLIAIGLGILALGSLSAGDVAITIDVSKPTGPINPVYRDFGQGGESADPAYLQPLEARMRELRPRLVRFDHVLIHYAKAEIKDGKMTVDFTALDKYIDSIRAMGAQPLMCLSYAPTVFGNKAVIDPPADLEKWIELIYLTVRHVNVERKLGVKYWEVWNEPNLACFWTGSLDQYLDLYAATAKAALRADSTIKVGGGAFYSFDHKWITALMDYAKSQRLPLDFVSWHVYRDPNCGFVADVAQARTWLKERGMNAELIIDEWNFDGRLKPENDDNRGAAYVAKTLIKMMGCGLDYAPFFEIKDGPGPSRYYGRWGMFSADDHPKACYYAFKVFSMLDGKLLSLQGGTDKVGGLAAGKNGRAGIVLYNTEKKNAATIDLNITGLGSGRVRVRKAVIDEKTCNPAGTGGDDGLELVGKSLDVPVSGTLKMSVPLGAGSVTFISIEPTRQ